MAVTLLSGSASAAGQTVQTSNAICFYSAIYYLFTVSVVIYLLFYHNLLDAVTDKAMTE